MSLRHICTRVCKVGGGTHEVCHRGAGRQAVSALGWWSGVDDREVVAVVDQLLQRHRAGGRAGGQGCAAREWWVGGVLLGVRHPAPVWLCAGDARTAAELVGLSDVERAGGPADPGVVARWLDDGVAPNGECGRAFDKRAVHGFDLTFCAPKSVSLMRAVRGDDVIRRRSSTRTPPPWARRWSTWRRTPDTPGCTTRPRAKGPGAVAGFGGDRLPARDQPGGGSAPAHPCDRAQPPAARRREAGVDRRHLAVSRGPRRRGDLSGDVAP